MPKLLEINKVMLVGRLTRDPEVKVLESGQTVANIGLAVNRSYKKKDATEYSQEVAYVRCTLWGKQAELAEKYLKKGSPVYVEGRLVSDSWEDKDGNKRTSLNVRVNTINFLSTKKEDSETSDGVAADEVASDAIVDETDARPPETNEKKKSKVPF